MIRNIVSTLMCGLALFCGSSQVCAQTPAASYRKVKAASPIVSLGKFVLTTTPNGSGSTGSTGAKADLLYWDGYSKEPSTSIDPNTGQPIEVPITSRLAPEERDYYVVVTGILTVPSTIVTPASVQVTARRVRYTTNAQGQQVVTEMDEADEVTMYKVTQSNQGKPVVNSNGTTTYTYRTHDLMDEEELPHRKGGALDWKINDKKGRWQLQVKDYASNTVEFKIDKRGQIIGCAYEIADYETYLPKYSEGYNACDGFINAIYDRHGLQAVGKNWSMCVPDEGAGAIRFFEMKPSTGDYPNTFVTPPFSSAGHVAIQDAPKLVGRQMVDNNHDNSGAGPTVRAFDAGTGVPWSVIAKYWDNAVSGAPKGELDQSKSILQELDTQ